MTKSIAYTTYHLLKKQREQRDNRRNELPTPEPRNLSAIARQPIPPTITKEKTEVVFKQSPSTQPPQAKPVKVQPQSQKAENKDDYLTRLEKQINEQKATIKHQEQIIKSLQKNLDISCKFCGKAYSSRNPRVRFRTCGHYFCNSCATR